jgi:hypothetical protein
MAGFEVAAVGMFPKSGICPATTVPAVPAAVPAMNFLRVIFLRFISSGD